MSTLGVNYHAVALAAPFAYIADSAYSLQIIDTATNTLSPTTIHLVEGLNIDRMVMNSAGTQVYILGSGVVRVLDTASNTVKATIVLKTAEMECIHQEIAINPAGTQLFVTGRDNQSPAHECDTVIDTTTSQIKIFPIDYSSSKLNFDVTYINNDTVYIASNYNGQPIRVVNTSTNALKADIPSIFSGNMVVNPSCTKVYKTNGGNISVIDTATHTNIATIKRHDDRGGYALAVNPTGTRLYELALQSINVYDTATNTFIETVKGSEFVRYDRSYRAIAINLEGTRVYVTTADRKAIYGTPYSMLVIDTTSNAVIKTVKVDGNLLAMAPIYQPAASSTTTANCLFNWAEANYPTIFNPATQNTQQITGYDYRFYSGTNTYLGVYQGNNIHLLQPNVSPNILDVGTVAQFKPITGCQ